jgi:hypothetical protein
LRFVRVRSGFASFVVRRPDRSLGCCCCCCWCCCFDQKDLLVAAAAVLTPLLCRESERSIRRGRRQPLLALFWVRPRFITPNNTNKPPPRCPSVRPTDRPSSKHNTSCRRRYKMRKRRRRRMRWGIRSCVRKSPSPPTFKSARTLSGTWDSCRCGTWGNSTLLLHLHLFLSFQGRRYVDPCIFFPCSLRVLYLSLKNSTNSHKHSPPL